MSDIAIKVEGLSKAYQLGDFSTGTLSKDVERWWALMRGKEDPFIKVGESNDRTVKGSSNVVWSLKDISFEINQGDAVGIIGRNGAGKSTLLKILSRVTAPTAGSIKVKGRIASLLEVGTGFHPELTGRENIYLNGAILGMRKKEIARKFDEIVDFSGVERYIDTPVKRYSSGMYVRLAFAVAAYLESEILIVDEVLAVGDTEFQKKCLGKMGDVSKGEGRTVLFVSHQMNAITTLCNKAILLKNGSIETASDNVKQVVNLYLNNTDNNNALYWKSINNNVIQNPYFSPVLFCLTNAEGNLIDRIIDNTEQVFVKLVFTVAQFNLSLTFGYAIFNDDNQLIYSTYNIDTVNTDTPAVGSNTFISELPRRVLNEGAYRVEAVSSIHNVHWINEPGSSGINFNMEIKGALSDSQMWLEKRPGVMAPVIQWIKVKS